MSSARYIVRESNKAREKHFGCKENDNQKNYVAPEKRPARRAPEPEPVLSRATWGAIWGVLGLFVLLAILPIDGVLLDWLHRGIGAMIGKGSYLLPFALLALAGLLFARQKGPVRLRGTSIALLPLSSAALSMRLPAQTI